MRFQVLRDDVAVAAIITISLLLDVAAVVIVLLR